MTATRRLLAVVLTACLAVTLLPLAAAAAGLERPESWQPSPDQASGGTDQAVEGEYLVTFSSAQATRRRTPGVLERSLGLQAEQPIADRVALVTAAPGRDSAVAALLAARDDVVAVEPNVRRQFHAAPNDTSFDLQWAHTQTGIQGAWDSHTGGAAAGEGRPLIALIDSGIDGTHPDLADTVVSHLRSFEGQIFEAPAANDCIGHGTSVAGVAGAQGNNNFGVAGVLWQPRIIDIALTHQLNDCPGGPADADAITAMSYLTGLEEKPLAMNLSLGTSANSCTAAYQAAVDQAIAAGIAVVSSAGNAGTSAASVPASCNGAISVAAVTRAEQRADYSQFNPQVDLTGPGGQPENCPNNLAEIAQEAVLTTSLDEPKQYSLGAGCRPELTDPNGHRLEATQGTSFSTPYVTASIALLRQWGLDNGQPVSPGQAEALLEGTARDVGPAGRDQEYGWGVIDVGAAMAALQAGEIPPLQPDPDFPVTGGGDIGEAVRVANPADPTSTDPISQAVAISSGLPDGGAPFAVLARADDFADALAGAAVGLGIGPLLYTSSDGPLDSRTEQELLRVLSFADGPPTVYVMGGTAAVPAQVDQRLQQLGITVRRVAGTGREQTSVEAARVVDELLAQAPGLITRDHVFVVSGRDFADAVSAGQMAAYYGIPTLVTNREALNGDVAAEITRRGPSQVWVLGGVNAVSADAYAQVEALGFPTQRLAGETRIGTALEVFSQYSRELAADDDKSLEDAATIAVNLRHSFNDVLAATLIAGQGNWFFPVDGEDGSIITPDTSSRFCGFGGSLFVVGGTDRISNVTVDSILDILAGQNC